MSKNSNPSPKSRFLVAFIMFPRQIQELALFIIISVLDVMNILSIHPLYIHFLIFAGLWLGVIRRKAEYAVDRLPVQTRTI